MRRREAGEALTDIGKATSLVILRLPGCEAPSGVTEALAPQKSAFNPKPAPVLLEEACLVIGAPQSPEDCVEEVVQATGVP
jgi:hypothetical protein